MKHKVRGFVCLVAAIAALGAWAEVKWNYAQTSATKATLTEILPDGATYTAWVFNLNPSTGVLTKGTLGTGPVLDLRRETLPDGVPAFTGEFPKTYNDSGCSTCEEVYIPEGVASVAKSCFRLWTALKVVSLPEGLEKLGDSSFSGCAALTSVKIPETVSFIGTGVFQSCSNLKTIDPCFPNAVTNIGGSVVRDCPSLESEVRIGFATNSVTGEMMETAISAGNVIYNSSVKTVRFGPGVRSIPNSFFTLGHPTLVEYGCNMPEMFQNLKDTTHPLTNVIVRYKGDFSLPSSGFNSQSDLREITWDGFFTYPLNSAVFQGWTDLQCRFIVPADNADWQALMADSTKFTPWKDCPDDHDAYFAKYGNDAKEPAGITISQGANKNLPRVFIVLTDVEVTDFPLMIDASDGLTITRSPEPSADGRYPKGTVVTVTAEPQGGAKFIGWQGDVPPGCEHDQTIEVVMDGAKALTALAESAAFTYDSFAQTISDGVTTIKVTKNGDVYDLGEITTHRADGSLDLSKPIVGGGRIETIPNSGTTKISDNQGNSWLTSVKLPETLKTIAGSAFRYCSQLVRIEPFVPAGVTSLGDYCFRDCPNLTGELALGFATNATTGAIEATSVGGYLTGDSPQVQTLRVGPGVSEMPSTFFTLTNFRFIDIGPNVETVPALGAYGDVTNAVFRQTGVLTLSAGLFSGHKNLQEVTFGGWINYTPGVGSANPFNLWTDLQCRFIVPRTNDDWNVLMADPDRMTPWASCDAADKDAYFARYGASAVWPAGISVAVAGGLPRTYIVRTLEGADDVQLVAETSNGAMSSITLDPPPSPETGLYEADTQVTVTLTLKEGASLVGWEGDVAEADRTKTSFVVTMDKSKRVFAKVCVQPEIADGSFAVAFPHGDSQAKVSFALTGVAGAVYDATAEILVKNGGEWSVWQTLTGLTNGQAVSTWVPTPLEPSSTAEFTVRVAAPNAAARTTGTPDPVDVPSTWPTTWNKGGGEAVCHVKADATGDGSGSDWFNALTAIPLTEDELPAGRREIWVATNVVVGESAVCTLRAPVSFRGGFAGLETSAEARPAGLKSVLDGEGTRETFTLTASGAAGAEYAFERLVFTRSLTRGLSFTAAANANPILTAVDCDFIANGADGTINGRGLYLKNGGDSSLSNCTFQGNVCRSCSGNSAGSGFGAYFEGNDNRVFIDNCQFLTNGYVDVGYTTAFGAALYTTRKVVTVRNSAFRGNRSSVYGDGSIVHIAYTQANGGNAFTNCVFVGNELCETRQNGDRAGLVELRLASSAQRDQTVDFCNCTFAYNIGSTGKGCAGINAHIGTVHAVNCIFFDNVTKGTTFGADLSASSGDGIITAEYCLFAGEGTNYVKSADGGTLTLGEGIVYGDPKFVTPQSAFLQLTTDVSEDSLPQAGSGNDNPRFTEPFSPALLALDVHERSNCHSAAIDAGDPDGDYSMEPRPNGERLNLGAYGNTPEAALSPKGLVIFVQ